MFFFKRSERQRNRKGKMRERNRKGKNEREKIFPFDYVYLIKCLYTFPCFKFFMKIHMDGHTLNVEI